MKLLFFFFLNFSAQATSIADLFPYLRKQPYIFLDEWLSDLNLLENQISDKKPVSLKSDLWQLIQLSRSIPVRIANDKRVLKILPCIFRRNSETVEFRANLLAMYDSKLIDQIRSMDGWFLRCQVRYKVVGSQDQFILISLNMQKTFYLNQFYADFNSFSETLFGPKPYTLVLKQSHIETLQRDLLFEDHRGLLPDPYSQFNPQFAKIRRIAPGSTVQP